MPDSRTNRLITAIKQAMDRLTDLVPADLTQEVHDIYSDLESRILEERGHDTEYWLAFTEPEIWMLMRAADRIHASRNEDMCLGGWDPFYRDLAAGVQERLHVLIDEEGWVGK